MVWWSCGEDLKFGFCDGVAAEVVSMYRPEKKDMGRRRRCHPALADDSVARTNR